MDQHEVGTRSTKAGAKRTVLPGQHVRDVGQCGPTSQISHSRHGRVPAPDRRVPPRAEGLGLIFLREGYVEPDPGRILVS